MNYRDHFKELLPIIKAYTEGKTIQRRSDGFWEDKEEIDFLSSPSAYRIKPEPEIPKEFLQAMKECNEGKLVDLDTALTKPYPK